MNLSYEKYDNFVESIKIGNIEDVKSNFDFRYFDKTDKYGLKPIHWACLSSNIKILEWILKKKCNIEMSSRNGWRSIHFATFIGNLEMVTFLIERFCKFDCETNNGETVLDIANGKCNHEFIDKILNENINWKIGLSIGLKCGGDCDHQFCLRSVYHCKFDKLEQIYLGRFSVIHKVKDSNSIQQFAVKTIKIAKYDSFPNEKCLLRNFNDILPNLNHTKIMKYYGLIKTNTEMILFMELMNNGSLYEKIKLDGVLNDCEIYRYCTELLDAVAFLHNKKILHKFINPANILINRNGGCKLTISIFSCLLTDCDAHVVKDLWTSDFFYYPFYDSHINETLSYPFDIWNLGYTVIDMLKGNYLQNRMMKFDELENFISQISNQNIKSFIKTMMIINPNDRATVDELLKHEFIKNISMNNYSKIDNTVNNTNTCISTIQNAINNKKIGLSMGLKCEDKCQHEFCLSCMAATKFKEDKIIGKGSGGKVYKLELNSGMYWAMKKIKNVDGAIIQEESKYFENDINRYREFINHDNIVKYFGAVRNLKKLFIFMEFVDGGSLNDKIKRNKYNPLSLTTIKQYTKQILEGLKLLHEKQIIHRDIKSANILINEYNIVKIADFGLSRFLRTISKDKVKTCCGTYNYMSPEMIKNKPYDCSADIWSLGATVFEMATGHPPYHNLSHNNVIFIIGKTRKIEYPSDLSDNIKGFLNLMINVDPKNRSSAESLLICQFFNGIH